MIQYPFTVYASHQGPGQPDFVVEDASSRRGLEVTEAGSQSHQARMTEIEDRPAETHLIPGDGWTLQSIADQVKGAIGRKVRKFDLGWYATMPCDLAVYNNTEDALDDDIVSRVNDACLRGRFRIVYLIDCSGERVYADVLSSKFKCIDISADYDIDFARWISDQVHSLRSGKWDRLNIENLVEELDAVARRDRRSVRSYLRNLFAHLLKWHFQPQTRSASWSATINGSCDEIGDLLQDSPSLRRMLDPKGGDVANAYSRARRVASNETGMTLSQFPDECPWFRELAEEARKAGIGTQKEPTLAALRRELETYE
ncbi:MAG: DUF29 domain-containing protein [Gammaproteobacteria bacterium]|nr:DUF29 domain-containing protein [Gammaproteobacteria bacterium]